MPNVDRNSGIHSCSYECLNPACVLRQRNELRDKLGQMSRRKQAKRIADLEAEVDRWMTVAQALQAQLAKPRVEYWPTTVTEIAS